MTHCGRAMTHFYFMQIKGLLGYPISPTGNVSFPTGNATFPGGKITLPVGGATPPIRFVALPTGEARPLARLASAFYRDVTKRTFLSILPTGNVTESIGIVMTSKRFEATPVGNGSTPLGGIVKLSGNDSSPF